MLVHVSPHPDTDNPAGGDDPAAARNTITGVYVGEILADVPDSVLLVPLVRTVKESAICYRPPLFGGFG